MLLKFKLNKSFEIGLSTAGFVFLFAGIGILFYSYLGIILILLGILFAFTYNQMLIDVEQKRYKEATLLMGVFSLGQWTPILPTMKLKVRPINYSWQYNSLSNKEMLLKDVAFYVILLNDDSKEIAICAKIKDEKDAINKMNELGNRLNLKPIY